MRSWLCMLFFAACAERPAHVLPDLEAPLDAVWPASIHPGDMVVLVPGTGAYDYLAAVIDKMPGEVPVASVRTSQEVYDDCIVFEQAIAAAHRAGIPDSMLEDGTVPFAIWGAGFVEKHAFVYESFEGLHIPISILGGGNTCAYGSVTSNLLNYNAANAKIDASDLYQRLQAWLPAHGSPRNLMLASHSWGGAIAEYFTLERAQLAASFGSLDANVSLTVAMGVPGFVPGYTFQGPGLRDRADGSYLYEIDRPDDPVHSLDPNGNGGGHQYAITFGDEFIGAYGITTDELSCLHVPGACAHP